jgi:tubulin polyglutamylase TTLL9
MPAPVAPGSPDNSDDEGQTNKAATHGRLVKLWKERVAGQRAPKGKFRFRTAFRNCIFDVCHAKGWKETDSETDWDFLWVERDWIRGVYDKIRLDDHQRVNHFRNFFELTRKDCMIKNLKRAKRNLAKNGHTDEADQYDFYPDTFTLPGEYLLFVEEFKKQASKDAMWIMKPIGKCQGAGIFLFDKLSQISEWRNDTRWKPENPQAEKYVAQRYIPNPYLIGGKKFDLRLYVLCTSYQPLTIYMYREGFARFTSSRFTMAHGNMADKYIHLTNVAIQKKGDNYDQDTGGKMHVRDLKLYLISKYVPTQYHDTTAGQHHEATR